MTGGNIYFGDNYLFNKFANNRKLFCNFSCFDVREVDTSIEEFVSEERQRISNEDQRIRASDQKCITHYPPIKRGREYTSYFRTSGLY